MDLVVWLFFSTWKKKINFFLKEGGVVINALGLWHVVTNFCTAERAILGLRK